MLFESKETLKPLSTAVEFQTIIFAGFGNNLYPLTEESNLPKALLPIANEPLITYPLRWCEQAGLQACLVVCHAESYAQILAFVRNEYLGPLKISIESAGKISDSHGTGDVLRRLKHKIKALLIRDPPSDAID
ncbi:putative translation initiation factor eIF-2B subunit gamma [Neolecta irregularis DAH-3]|uniref:Translation initiation factor eIF2B subunit gamma n=1 Tax=Neolecta irregularis (strain DAH-3) TaxID=1198029 RepID=A0A1U7LMM5_NEOID|nr:putative translation initiation factor eIF-2B subunit gamma [Neolecta irregularis DAH-3]|eukprot:OLL23920.1 putative translation initiation factor eIF-2B subunit gamma [Neolecta irregularis DAH-3]